MRKALILGAAVLVCAAVFAEAAEGPDMDAVYKRSVVSLGDMARVDHALAKARRGEETTVAVIGGSITGGAAASKWELNYGSLLAAWWQKTFPQAKIDLVNAGIGATGSDYGTLRAQRDLLSKHPDFIVIEFGVNDGVDQRYIESYEGLVRQCLKQPNQPAVVLLFMMDENGGSREDQQAKVGEHYDLPMVSYRDALWPEIQAGRLTWKDISPDTVHPNDRGHAMVAEFIERVLQAQLDKLPEDDKLAEIKAVPAPLYTDEFEHVALFEADALTPTKNDGWTLDKDNHCWKADKPGSVIEFEVEGRAVFASIWTQRAAMGKASIQVDDGKPMTVDAWFAGTWGWYRATYLVANGLQPGKHVVRIEVLDEKDAESTGNEVRLLGLGTAGLQ